MTSTSLDDAPLTGFHKRLATYASGGAFMQGYILSITGVAMVQIAPQLNLDPLQQGLVVGSALIGGLPGAYFEVHPEQHLAAAIAAGKPFHGQHTSSTPR